MKNRNFLIAVIWAALAIASQARAADSGDWIATWTASPQPVWDADFLAPVKVPRNLWNQTIRQVASISIGGKRVQRHRVAGQRPRAGR
jgi:hypothetical protein